MSSLSPVMQPSLQPQTTPTFQPSHKPTFLATSRPSFAPSTQPSLKPRGTFFNNELYVYAAVSLFLIIALICICMVVRQGCLNKMVCKLHTEMRMKTWLYRFRYCQKNLHIIFEQYSIPVLVFLWAIERGGNTRC